MQLGSERESKNFQDMTYAWAGPEGSMGRHLIGSLLSAQNPTAFDPRFQDTIPGGYSNWLNQQLKLLTPDDWKLMKARGYNVNDMMIMKNFQNGVLPADPHLMLNGGSGYPK